MGIMAKMGEVVRVRGVGGMVEMVKYGIFGIFLTYILDKNSCKG